MSETTKVDKPQPGSISLRNGKATIIVDENGKTEDFGIDFVARHMKKSTTNVGGFYAKMIRKLSDELRSCGMTSVPRVQKVLKTLAADKRQGIRECCKQWDAWLRQILMFKNIKTGSQLSNPHKNFRDNFDKIVWKEPEVTVNQEMVA